MNKKQAYTYTVLRYVHDVVSGESLNVGVVLHTPAARFLRGRTRKTIRRLKQVFPDLDRNAFVRSMKAVDRGLTALAQQPNSLFEKQTDARGHALKVLPSDDSSLQWSPAGAGLTDDPEKTLDRLYERHVVRYDLTSVRRRTDEDVWRPVQDKLAERGIDVPFQPKAVVGTQDSIVFEKAWQNGHWHAYEPVSLDLADADGIKDKARRWRGHLAAVAEGTPEEIHLHFLLGRPQNTSLLDAYKTAKAIMEHAHFATEVVDENEIDNLIESIETEYHTQ